MKSTLKVFGEAIVAILLVTFATGVMGVAHKVYEEKVARDTLIVEPIKVERVSPFINRAAIFPGEALHFQYNITCDRASSIGYRLIFGGVLMIKGKSLQEIYYWPDSPEYITVTYQLTLGNGTTIVSLKPDDEIIISPGETQRLLVIIYVHGEAPSGIGFDYTITISRASGAKG